MAIKTACFPPDRNPMPSRPVAQTATQMQRRHIRSQLPSLSGAALRKQKPTRCSNSSRTLRR